MAKTLQKKNRGSGSRGYFRKGAEEEA